MALSGQAVKVTFCIKVMSRILSQIHVFFKQMRSSQPHFFSDAPSGNYRHNTLTSDNINPRQIKVWKTGIISAINVMSAE